MLVKALEGVLARPITRPGQMLGDLPYLPPERTQGGTEADPRSDLYGLGATVYALIAGRPPFTDATPAGLVQKIRTAQPEKPKQFQMSIPDQFQDTVLRLLAKRPEERFASAGDLLIDLERVGKFTGVTA